jgi:hypothetical protein
MITIFISYSHQDEKPWKDFVVSHLKVAERQGVFDVWDDRRIKGGGDWQAEIDDALAKASIAVLLISRHFLTSTFIMDHEVRTMLQRHADHDVILYPILISDCAWESVGWLKSLTIRPTDGAPLNSFDEPERDQIMTGMASEIGRMLHPGQSWKAVRAAAAPAKGTEDQRQKADQRQGFLRWWRSADATARTAVLAGALAGLGLLWAIMSEGDRLTAECSSVNTGGAEGADITVEC